MISAKSRAGHLCRYQAGGTDVIKRQKDRHNRMTASSVLLYVHIDHKDYQGRGGGGGGAGWLDGDLHFHTAPEL